jgi:hypothetical protein
LTKNFHKLLPSAFQNFLPNPDSVADIIAKIPADFCNLTPPIFAITPPAPADFCKFAIDLPLLLCLFFPFRLRLEFCSPLQDFLDFLSAVSFLRQPAGLLEQSSPHGLKNLPLNYEPFKQSTDRSQ